ncbi:orotate phosphoribosyltransferase [Lactobacillus hominis]|uniref:Orotate phosphoribosyltransferase n=1 Tax=Lactobacillus hominis DSM 23910 = CRBIP 24.179 TaxID=1423758 RepID=I7LAF1_9LACO|nr:orotate phosphoribosyltransferase [Lactobacillus hominis]KRM84504.1 orotate phosphoribosyltransferase [Lactobacillus hominis DSM 23910 = CRBIP 24.179]MCT3348173.1 orotate phosphoribosyltransferase [Lactobacillus hominis]CCI82199.1 Orotate phosphoribosyltransferase [Lactobacillus hominis DSM 23910 = CRBIP 24.179]
MYQKEIIDNLIKEKIVTISPDKPFTYASGMLSPIYTDFRLTISYPKLRTMIAKDLASLIKKTYPDATVIGGVVTAGLPHAAWVAQELDLPMIYVRPKPKDHGKGRQIEGRFSQHDKIVLIDDLVTTGGSVLQAVKACQKDGGNVIGVSSIFTYYLPDAKKNFVQAKMAFAPLLSYPELLTQEKESGHLSQNQYELLKTWHQDPWNWQV